MKFHEKEQQVSIPAHKHTLLGAGVEYCPWDRCLLVNPLEAMRTYKGDFDPASEKDCIAAGLAAADVCRPYPWWRKLEHVCVLIGPPGLQRLAEVKLPPGVCWQQLRWDNEKGWCYAS